MPEFVVVVSDPKSGRAFQVTVSGDKAAVFLGKKIGDTVRGSVVGLDDGYVLKITGGTDKDGFPMRPDIHGPVRKEVLLSGPPGFWPKRKGERRKKTVRGNVISEEIRQINTVIVEYGSTPLDEFFKKKEEGGESEG